MIVRTLNGVPLVKEVGRMTRINKITKQGVAEIPTGYNNPDQPKMREPFLVDSFDQAQQMQEDELAENLIQLIDDFNIVWAKLDKIMNSTSTLFKIQNRYYVNKDEWMEIQGKISEAEVMDRGTMYQMEAGVEKYWCDTQIKGANHLVESINQLNGALEVISHIQSHLNVKKEGLEGNVFITEDRSLDDAPF